MNRMELMNSIMHSEQAFADFITYKTAINLTPIYVQEDTMNTHEHSPEAVARSHLRNDLSTHYSLHDRKLMKHFHLVDDDDPETAEAAVERIKSGMFQLKDKKDRSSFAHWTNHIRWRDPTKEKDEEGYQAAYDKMKVAYKHAQQDVLCDSLDKAKAAVRKFEEHTFH